MHNLLFVAGHEKKVFLITSSTFTLWPFYVLQDAVLGADHSTIFEETAIDKRTKVQGDNSSYTVNIEYLNMAIDDWLNTN